MKLSSALILAVAGSVTAFQPHTRLQTARSPSSHRLNMVLEKPKEKTLAKIEQLKVESGYLTHPLQEVRVFEMNPEARS